MAEQQGRRKGVEPMAARRQRMKGEAGDKNTLFQFVLPVTHAIQAPPLNSTFTAGLISV